MARKKPRTPQDIAKAKPPKKGYSLFLEVAGMDRMQQEADKADVKVSELVDEAIRHYLEAIGEEPK